MVLPDRLSIDVQALSFFDPGVRGFCMEMTGSVLMTRGKDIVYLYPIAS